VLRTNRTSTVVRRPPRNAHRLRHVGDPARQRSRHTTGRCTALPAAQDVACLAVAPAQAATEEAGLALLFAKLSGTALSAGAILLFSPIIVNLLRSKDGEGISCTTFWMQLVGFSAIFIYNHSKGFPIAAYGENISLAAQSLVILLLATYYQGRLDTRFVVLLALFFVWISVSLSGMLAPALLSAMQIAATGVLTGLPSPPSLCLPTSSSNVSALCCSLISLAAPQTGAIIPQIVLNFQQKGTGAPRDCSSRCPTLSLYLLASAPHRLTALHGPPTQASGP